MINFLKGKVLDLCIEIGAFEGATSNLIVRHLSHSGKLICIDPLEDTYLTKDLDKEAKKRNNGRWQYFRGQYKRFKNNVQEHLASGRIELIRKTSREAFPELSKHTGEVDFCFIDGDHRTSTVHLDGVECFKLCKIGGHILFHDYGWGKNDSVYDCGKGIDACLSEIKGGFEIIPPPANMDDSVGTILDKLREKNLYENTILIKKTQVTH